MVPLGLQQIEQTRTYAFCRDGHEAFWHSAFDAYKAETLRRLEDEQGSFEAFLERLRAAKDKAEFDQFMDERAHEGTKEAAEDAEPVDGK